MSSKLGLLLFAGVSVFLAGCSEQAAYIAHPEVRARKTRDLGIIGNNPLQGMQAGVWTDPRGCDHWMIDDGVEGYLSARLGPDGKPVCSGTTPPEYVQSSFKGTSDIRDPL